MRIASHARGSEVRAVEALEERVVLSADAFAIDYEFWRAQTYSIESMTAIQVDSGAIDMDAIANDAQAHALIGLPQVRADYPYTGTGYAVAIIDTGVDYNHAALGGGWGNRVIAGWDFVNNDGNPMDDHGHGTHVAGIIAGNDATYGGIAPNANIVALKVLGADGSGNFGNVEAALQWVLANRALYNIVAVNMSLGAGNFSYNPYTFLEDELASLSNQGVFIAVASGNSFYSYNSTPGVAYPAISSNVVAVGAVWDANVGSVTWSSGARDFTTAPDRITSFSQRGVALDLVAPGAFITAAARGGGFVTMAGTSMASPMVAGAALLIHQALDAIGQSGAANQAYILALLKANGVTVHDGDDENDNVVNTGLSFSRINLYAAMAAIGAGGGGGGGGGGGSSVFDFVAVGGNGSYYLDSSADDMWSSADTYHAFGTAGGIALAGDWNGDGVDEIGFFKNGYFYLDLNGDGRFGAGDAGFRFLTTYTKSDFPVIGDWNRDGRDEVGIFRNGTFYLDLNGNRSFGKGDLSFQFGAAWDIPFAGDFNGDGRDQVGIFRRGLWALNTNYRSHSGFVLAQFGMKGDLPVVGDWNGDGRDDLAIYRQGQFVLDMDGNRAYTPGVDRNFYFPGFGAGWFPISGRWTNTNASRVVPTALAGNSSVEGMSRPPTTSYVAVLPAVDLVVRQIATPMPSTVDATTDVRGTKRAQERSALQVFESSFSLNQGFPSCETCAAAIDSNAESGAVDLALENWSDGLELLHAGS